MLVLLLNRLLKLIYVCEKMAKVPGKNKTFLNPYFYLYWTLTLLSQQILLLLSKFMKFTNLYFKILAVIYR